MESRSVGNHRMMAMIICEWSPSHRRMQRTSIWHRTTNTEKIEGQFWDVIAFFAIFQTFCVEISINVAGKRPELLRMPR